MPELYEDAELPEGVKLYRFEDYDTHRGLIFDDVKNTFAGRFPMVRNGVRMDVSDLRYADKEHYSIQEQKRALLEDKYLIRRLKGKITLTDEKTGALLDEKDMTLMRVPYLTDRGTFIRDGNEWGTISQQRLLPGAYSRYQNNGDLETQFNVRPGTGNAFRVNFNPESAVYKFSIAGSQLHLYSLMHDLGVSDDELRERWGDEVLDRNAAGYDPKVLERAYAKIVPSWDRDKNPGRSREEMAALVKKALDRSQVATDVVKHTLPNMFDRTKAATWKNAEEGIDKVASLTHKELKELAVYINHAEADVGGNAGIDHTADKKTLKEEIINSIRSGNRSGTYNGKYSSQVKAVQEFNKQEVMKKILSKINSK